jgi:excisionase family DNA binding protein
MDEDRKFYTVKEIANLYRVSYHLVLKAIKSGRLKAFKVTEGRRSPYRIAEHELLIFQANGSDRFDDE